MVKVTREAAQAHRSDLIEAAGRLFREKGLDGVGVAEIGRSAGLTHGAIYSSFASKDELAVAAFKAGQDASRARRRKNIGEEPDVRTILTNYVSKRQRDDRLECCPMIASASEAARQGPEYRSVFAGSFFELAAEIQAAAEKEGAADARRRSFAIVAGMIGAVAVARSLGDAEAEELLEAATSTFTELLGGVD